MSTQLATSSALAITSPLHATLQLKPRVTLFSRLLAARTLHSRFSAAPGTNGVPEPRPGTNNACIVLKALRRDPFDRFLSDGAGRKMRIKLDCFRGLHFSFSRGEIAALSHGERR